MSTYDAAATDRLLGDWASYWSEARDAVQDWDQEGLTLAQRAWKLALNDPYATALMSCVTGKVLGQGLRFVSQYQEDTDPQSGPTELDIRRQINDAVAAHSRPRRLDPGAQLSRLTIETQLVVSGFIAGDGFANRTWSPNRPGGCAGYATCWRPIAADRVCNPKHAQNESGRLVNGIELRDGVPVRLHYRTADGTGWTSVDWYALDGSPNVIHYAPDRQRAGGVRGFSKFAPILKLATHLSRLAISHVAGKRVQAAHPMTVQSSDPSKAAALHREQARHGPNSAINDATVLFVGKDSNVTFPTFSYQGSDYDAFVRTTLMAFCASWGYPWQFVLHQLTDANLASAQAALDQADSTTQIYQDGVIAEISSVIDSTIISEARARGAIAVAAAVPSAAVLVGTYDRPRRADANRLRTRQAGEMARTLGVSPSTVLAEMGYNFENEVRRTAQDADFAAINGVQLNGQPVPPPAPAPAPAPAPVPEPEDEPEDEAADAQAVQAAALSRPATIFNVHLPASPPPAAAPAVTVHNHVPPNAAPVVHVQAAAPAMPPSVVVHVDPTPVTIQNQVDVQPSPSAPIQVLAQAAPAAVTVQAAPASVTIDNQVIVPSRPVRAIPQGDGSVLMVPQEPEPKSE